MTIQIRRRPVLILVASIILYSGYNFIFLNEPWLRGIGADVFLLICEIICFVSLCNAYKTISHHKSFWLFLSIGVLFSLSGNIIWLYSQLTSHVIVFSNIVYLVWLVGHIFFIVALIFKSKEINSRALANIYLFNIVIFMITAASIITQYLIGPYLGISITSLLHGIATVVYLIAVLSILFIITMLYILIQHGKEQSYMLFITMGLFFLVIADLLYSYRAMTNNYHPGHIIDFLWGLATLFVSFGGYYVKIKTKEDTHEEVMNPAQRRETIFPYLSILLLMFLVSYSYHWAYNSLSYGLLVIFLLVLGRQLIIMNRNKRLIDEYKYLAHHDPLTGLYNRTRFSDDLKNIMKTNTKAALLLIDLDRFKVINDTLGHYFGDRVLIETTKRLGKILGKEILMFRLGGDEFIIILQNTTEEKCTRVAQRILDEFENSFNIDDTEIMITSSIGISMFPEHGDNQEDLLKHADAAMYLAKENGKNNFQYYNNQLHEILSRRMTIEKDLRMAIEKEQFSLYYQSKVELKTRKIIGMEALLRWNHPDLGVIGPDEFIPIAEETGQIIAIGEWVLRTACRQNKRWQEKGFPELCVSVNVSVAQFHQNDFIVTVEDILKETKLKPGLLELEITESIMQNINESTNILYHLSDMGIKTSIDDFGTGYSSLYILQKLPINTIKIDKTFINDIEDFHQRSMLKTIIDMGINFRLDIVAEGVETEKQLRVLLDNKCQIGQGFLFSKAVPCNEFEQYLLQLVS